MQSLCADHRHEGSYGTKRERKAVMKLFARQLSEAGYRDLTAKNLKGRHVNALVARWQREELSASTMKNRMRFLRWWARKVGKPSLVARTNDHYGIPRWQQVSNMNKTVDFKDRQIADRLKKVTDERTQLSLRLQAEFGMRREESIKFMPSYADKRDEIRLKGS